MSGIIFDIKRFAIHDGPGIRTTIFLKGCPMRCKWCHNPEGWNSDPCVVNKKTMLDGILYTEKETIGRVVSVDEVMADLEKERLVMEESGGGVTFSGGEPLMQPQFLTELLRESCLAGFLTAVDTSGYCLRSDLKKIIPYTNLFLYDLKLMDDRLHEKYTGVSSQVIRENFKWLTQQGKTIRVRIPVIRNITGEKENIDKLRDFLLPYKEKIQQIDLLPYHRTGMNKYAKLGIRCEMPGDEEKPEKKEMEEHRLKFEKEGFKVKTGG